MLKFVGSLLIICLFFIVGCRGWSTEKTPIHLNPNMDLQPKYKPYRENNWFSNGMNMRPLVKGVIPRGYLKADDSYYRGKINDQFVENYPTKIKITKQFVKRGQDRFNIYCAVCHDAVGGGNGLVGEKMLIKPMSLHGEYMYNLSLGRLFDIVSNGSRTMPAHRLQIVENDRWAIVAYVKALQISQNADGDW